LVHLAVKDDETEASAKAFLEEALAAFPFRVTHVLTDRGSCFTAEGFEKACRKHAVEHRKTRPYTPRTNGMVERFNGRVQREVLGITVASHRDLERLLLGFNSASNARRQRVLDGPRLECHSVEPIEPARVRGPRLPEQRPQNGNAFFETRDALACLDAHDLVLERLRRALLVGSTEADGQPGAALGQDVQARPLLGEDDGLPVHEGGHATDGQSHAPRDAGQRGQERDGLEARLGQQAVTDPDRIEGAGGLGRGRQLEEIAGLESAKHHRAVREDQAERVRHLYLPRYVGGRLSRNDRTPSS